MKTSRMAISSEQSAVGTWKELERYLNHSKRLFTTNVGVCVQACRHDAQQGTIIGCKSISVSSISEEIEMSVSATLHPITLAFPDLSFTYYSSTSTPILRRTRGPSNTRLQRKSTTVKYWRRRSPDDSPFRFDKNQL